MNHDAPGDEARVFAGMNHLRQPVKRRVGVAATHGLDERGNRVVMRVAIAIVNHGFFLDALLGDGQVDVNETIACGRSRERGDFQRVQRLARVAIGHFGKMAQRSFVSFDLQLTQAAFLVAQRPLEQLVKLVFAERAQFENL